MRPRQLPQAWYFTDPRAGDALWGALDRLPRGSGVVFRHHGLAPGARKSLLRRVRAVTRRRGLVLVIGGEMYGVRGDGVHGSRGRGRGDVVTASAHDRAELVRAWRAGAALVFVSPVFATRSHPGTRVLGRVRFGLLVRGAGVAVAALGGMTPRRFGGLRGLGAMAWGAIDAWEHSPNRR